MEDIRDLNQQRLMEGAIPPPEPDSSLHGISQAKTLEWVAISFSRGSSWTQGLLGLFLWPLLSPEAEALPAVLSLMEAEALTTSMFKQDLQAQWCSAFPAAVSFSC